MLIALFIVFLVLKLAGLLHIGWCLVFLPLIGSIAIWFLTFFLAFIAAIFGQK